MSRNPIKELPKSKNHIYLLVITLIMSFLGLIFVFESSTAESFTLFDNQYHFLFQHSIGLVIGLVALIIGLIIPSKLWIKSSLLWYIVGIILLCLVFVPGL